MRENGGNYRRGVMSLVLLSLLKRGDMYGYQLVQETERASGGKLTTQEGSLYPVLYKLQERPAGAGGKAYDPCVLPH